MTNFNEETADLGAVTEVTGGSSPFGPEEIQPGAKFLTFGLEPLD